ncbi:hypothetical protein VOLCADRAFT_93305 [Volvox carteri f. nagariensis]|uniref:Sulfotransferase n=1 Tax=Volvox carteri f. nagariensis TaxID=3068 RepID=D8U1S7_VOLCA|nr:uncharacterized protein VOLCADRAFT_93305 [Volvox carteri f. nagariensis]EFJ46165.1 hypothetical protein VOLCADRAFT_93305 [Volvox carteri f. nagariensis]|eukprot:XP_002952612.1 hypothetical protein VOLCADRAFT_93305 [Volvox carteri f. nagariensis]
MFRDLPSGRKTRTSLTEVVSPRIDNVLSASPLFEQAFTSTFDSKDPEQLSRTLSQYVRLMSWVEQTPQLNDTQLAFLPEFGSSAALEIVHAAAKLSRGNDNSNKPDLDDLVGELKDIGSKLLAASATSPWRGFPATRRILLGAILQKRLDFGGRFPPDVEAAVDALLVQLFQLHKASAAARGAVQFFHISKSGGTNLCQAAGANGCASQGFDTRTNCLIRDFADQPRWVSYNAHKFLQYRMSSRQGLPWFVNFHSFRPPYTCEQRRAYLLRDGLTFYANEYTNPPFAAVETTTAATTTTSETATSSNTSTATATTAAATTAPSGSVIATAASAVMASAAVPSSRMCEKEFVNLLMMRHPHDRLRSQIGWVQKLYKEYYLDVDTQPAFLNRTCGFWERLMPAAVNNYYIRSLLGSRFFEFPVLEIMPQHVALAKLAVLQHDILLVLEDKARNEMALRLGLGWATAGLRDDAVRSSSELGDEVALPLDYSALQARNMPDVELYGFAREMQALDALLWNFVAAADARLDDMLVGSNGSDAGEGGEAAVRCGYVSMGSTEAVAALQDQLSGVEVPPKMTMAAGAAAAAALAAPPTGSAATDAAASSTASSLGRNSGVSSAHFNSSALLPLGPERRMRGGAGGRGPSVVSINRRNGRRLLRLKTLQGWVRHRKQERQPTSQ